MYKKILFPVDLGDPESQEKSLATAIQLAEKFEASLHIMTVVPDYGSSIVAAYFPENHEKTMIEDTRVRLDEYIKEKIPAAIHTQEIVAHGSIYNEILNYADSIEADLIVMASHRPQLKDYLVGPNATKVVSHARCSTMVVRS